MAKHPFTFIRDDDYCVVRVVAEQYMKEHEGFGDYNIMGPLKQVMLYVDQTFSYGIAGNNEEEDDEPAWSLDGAVKILQDNMDGSCQIALLTITINGQVWHAIGTKQDDTVFN